MQERVEDALDSRLLGSNDSLFVVTNWVKKVLSKATSVEENQLVVIHSKPH